MGEGYYLRPALYRTLPPWKGATTQPAESQMGVVKKILLSNVYIISSYTADVSI